MRRKRGVCPEIVLLSLLAVCMGAAGAQAGQAPRSTDVYLAPILKSGLGPVLDVTADNPGYDSQPAFLSNSKTLLFSSNRDGQQTDIYRYDVKSKRATRLTKTEDSEYSPMPAPDGKSLSAVSLEESGLQRLWRFRNDGSQPQVMLADVKPIASYVWIDRTRLALAVIDARRGTMTLDIADADAQTTTVVAPNVGRSLAMEPGTDNVTFVAKAAGAGRWLVKTVDASTRRVTTLVAAMKSGEDLAWTPGGDLLMAQGTTLYRWKRGETTWTRFADVPADMCANVTHPAVSPDGRWLAFAADPVAK